MSASETELASFHAIVRGRVQGVFFRAFVKQQARALGLAGYVRNMRQFWEVEVEAEGNRAQLEKLLEHLHKGPAGAGVEEVAVRWGDHAGAFADFTIRY